MNVLGCVFNVCSGSDTVVPVHSSGSQPAGQQPLTGHSRDQRGHLFASNQIHCIYFPHFFNRLFLWLTGRFDFQASKRRNETDEGEQEDRWRVATAVRIQAERCWSSVCWWCTLFSHSALHRGNGVIRCGEAAAERSVLTKTVSFLFLKCRCSQVAVFSLHKAATRVQFLH